MLFFIITNFFSSGGSTIVAAVHDGYVLQKEILVVALVGMMLVVLMTFEM
ncbi:hypothetical protein Pint_20103 [Pistacia integerrima]|uniref:Uncharacterized protein n=1 Tax=Pistacia integerrima TaxID=434235 RepID=A0ACC0XAM7_9ROSI|nr:hypothetical protein Pint_20103 [Pistacia integerrima]